MKFNNKILSAVAVGAMLIACSARAQLGWDAYKAIIPLEIAPVQAFAVNGGVGLITNAPVDTFLLASAGANGWGAIHFTVLTNSSATTISAQILTSQDQTNWFPLLVSIATPTSFVYSNYTFGALGTNIGNGTVYYGLTSTNVYDIPYSTFTPSAWSAGYATPTPIWNPATNSTVSLLQKYGNIGFPWGNVNRYMEVVWTLGGTLTNASASATLYGTALRNPGN